MQCTHVMCSVCLSSSPFFVLRRPAASACSASFFDLFILRRVVSDFPGIHWTNWRRMSAEESFSRADFGIHPHPFLISFVHSWHFLGCHVLYELPTVKCTELKFMSLPCRSWARRHGRGEEELW
uniref:Uncharacterized protein n=1 Tax=Oryza brachyantha TaxID=4533 RepID=J3MGP0_ORYBR